MVSAERRARPPTTASDRRGRPRRRPRPRPVARLTWPRGAATDEATAPVTHQGDRPRVRPSTTAAALATTPGSRSGPNSSWLVIEPLVQSAPRRWRPRATAPARPADAEPPRSRRPSRNVDRARCAVRGLAAEQHALRGVAAGLGVGSSRLARTGPAAGARARACWACASRGRLGGASRTSRELEERRDQRQQRRPARRRPARRRPAEPASGRLRRPRRRVSSSPARGPRWRPACRRAPSTLAAVSSRKTDSRSAAPGISSVTYSPPRPGPRASTGVDRGRRARPTSARGRR